MARGGDVDLKSIQRVACLGRGTFLQGRSGGDGTAVAAALQAVRRYLGSVYQPHSSSVHISQPYTDDFGLGTVLTISSPCYDKSGILLGVVYAGVSTCIRN